jgi:hypothetical protein
MHLEDQRQIVVEDDLLPTGWADWRQDEENEEPNVVRGTD